jgi:hypothetical protein
MVESGEGLIRPGLRGHPPGLQIARGAHDALMMYIAVPGLSRCASAALRCRKVQTDPNGSRDEFTGAVAEAADRTRPCRFRSLPQLILLCQFVRRERIYIPAIIVVTEIVKNPNHGVDPTKASACLQSRKLLIAKTIYFVDTSVSS